MPTSPTFLFDVSQRINLDLHREIYSGENERKFGPDILFVELFQRITTRDSWKVICRDVVNPDWHLQLIMMER